MPDIQRTLRCMDPSAVPLADRSTYASLQDWFAKNHTMLLAIDGVVGLTSPCDHDPAIVVRIDRYANGAVRRRVAQMLSDRPHRIETAVWHDSDPQLRLFDEVGS